MPKFDNRTASEGKLGPSKTDLATATAAARHGVLTPDAAASKTGKNDSDRRRKKLLKAFR